MHHIKPMVIKEGNKQRPGKGFSKEELKKAGINPAEAKKLKIPIDPRRNTTHEENIKTLKATYQEINKNVNNLSKIEKL